MRHGENEQDAPSWSKRGAVAVDAADRSIVRPVALVTGAARRVGRAVAECLAARGFTIALHYFRSRQAAGELAEQLRSRYGVEVAPIGADLTVAEAGEELVARVGERFGRVDLVVTCASQWESVPLERADGAALERAWRTNVLASYVPARACGLRMVSQDEGGCIVLIGDWAIARPYRDYAPYLVAKGAIPTLTRVLAVELAARNPKVRVNAILPGPVLLPEATGQAEAETVRRSTLVKAIGSPADVADLVVYFYEHPFVTGAVVPVDGGRSVYCPDEAPGSVG